MCRNTVIYQTDSRQKYLAELLPGRKAQKQNPYLEGNTGRIILPTPVSKLDKYTDEKDKIKEYLINVKGCVIVFGGKFTEEWKEFLERAQIPYVDFLEEENVALENARITAEAVLGIIINSSKYSLRTSKVMVAGYGRCGREIATLLQKTGARVTVLARSSDARREAVKDGCNGTEFSYGPEEAQGCQVLINTVPAKVIDKCIIDQLPKDSMIIDIASAPGGCDIDAIRERQLSYKFALGLPSLYMAKSGAEVFAEVIRNHTYYEQKIRENKGWIFQILL